VRAAPERAVGAGRPVRAGGAGTVCRGRNQP